MLLGISRQPSLCFTHMLRITWMLSGEEVARFSLEELSDVKALKQELNRKHRQPTRFRQKLFLCGDPLNDSALLDSPMELQLVLLPYDLTSETQAELATASSNGSVSKACLGKGSHRTLNHHTNDPSFSLETMSISSLHSD